MQNTSDEMAERINTLNAQIQFLIDFMNEKELLEDQCFTFPDGETVHATQVLRAPCDAIMVEEGVGFICMYEEGHPGIDHKWIRRLKV